MRISTNMIFDNATTKMSELQSSSAKIQEQLSSGKRILTPSDDPVAAARVVQVSQSKSLNDQFTANRVSANNDLTTLESTLSNVTDTLQDARLLTVTGGNGALTATERSYLATQLEGHFSDLLGFANTQDSVGNYIFAGYHSTTQPYSPGGSGASYNGDSGIRELQVGQSRTMAVSIPGSQVFDQVRTGNGTFQVVGSSANKGTGLLSTGVVTDSSLISGDTFSLDFNVAGGVTTYNVTNITTGSVVSSNNTYKAGDDITVSGMTFNIKGSPASGDKFDIEPSRNESVFKTVKDLISALRSQDSSSAGNAKLMNALSGANQQLSNVLDNVLSTRAVVGSNQNALTKLDDAGSVTDEHYQSTLRDLQDVDYVKAISDLSKQQSTLQAAQQSFVKVSSLSLFDYLK